MWAFTRQPGVGPTESTFTGEDSGCDANLHDLLLTCNQRLGISVLLAKLRCVENSQPADWLQSRSPRTGLTALQAACFRNVPVLAVMLLEAGADPNATTAADGSTAAHFAAAVGNPFLLHLLSLYGGNLNMGSSKGRVPAHSAAENGNPHALVWLLDVEKVCTVDVRDNSGLTPLHLACLQGDRIILECLLASIRHSHPWTTAADVEAPIINPILCQDNTGNTCLHTAFLEHSRDRTQRKAAGRAIFWTLLSNSPESAASLLASRNQLGQRPLEAFISSGRTPQRAFHGLLLLSTHLLALLRPRVIPTALTTIQCLLTGLQFLAPLLIAMLACLGRWATASVLPVYAAAGLLAVLLSRQNHRTCDGTEQQTPLFCGLFFSTVVCGSLYDLLHFQPSLGGTLGWVRFLPSCLGYPLWFATFGALCLGDAGRLVPQHVFRTDFAHFVESSTVPFLSVVKDLMVKPMLPTKLPELPNYSEAYCPSCDVLHPSVDVYVKHCKLCKRCYVGHDHHCLFIYNCVAGRNIRFFLFFLLLTALLALVFSVMSLAYACQYCGREEPVKKDHPGAYRVYMLASCILRTLPCLSVLLLTSLAGGCWLFALVRSHFIQFTHQNSSLIARSGLWRVLLGLRRSQL